MRRYISTVAAGVGLAAFCGLALARAGFVDDAFGRFTGCNGCLGPSSVANDAYLLGGLVGLLALSRISAAWALRIPLAGAAAAIVVFYGLDIGLFRLLNHRLLADDLLHYGADSGIMLRVVTPFYARPEAWLLTAGWALAIAAWIAAIATGPVAPRKTFGTAVTAGAVALGAGQVEQAQYLHGIAFRNFVQVNFEVDPDRPYTAAMVERLSRAPALEETCEAGEERRPPVILVVVESLSAYHSDLFSSLNDATPELDRIARQGTWFPGFHANGFSTETGLIAILTGHVPLPTAGRMAGVSAFEAVEDDFHEWLARQGYTTAFFTSGTLDVGNREEWLQAIGISRAVGANDPFYDGMPRGMFEAASDAALFERVLRWQLEAQAGPPYMATVLTVGTHPPYFNAGGGSDELARFRALDRELAHFVATLRERGFLDHGILVIMGDHRAMTPIPERERHVLGAVASMRVPAIALGATGLPRGPVRGRMQQVDLIPSLRHVIGSWGCRNETEGRFLGKDPRAATFTLHPDPLRRNEVMVAGDAAISRIVLDGDDTRWIVPPRDAAAAERLLAYVNAERISRMPELRMPAD